MKIKEGEIMSYNIIIDAVTLILGIYIICVSFRMKKSGRIESSFLAEEEMKKVKDTAGYIEDMYPKSLIFGGVITAISIVAVISDFLKKIPYWSYIEMIIFVLIIIWFSNMLRNAREKFVK